MLIKRIFMDEAGNAGSGKQGDLPLGDKAKAGDDAAAKLAAEIKAKDAEIEKFRAAEAKRAEADKKAADAKALEEGKAKELLAAREKELAAERDRIAAFEKREKEAAKVIFDALPDAEKEAAKLLSEKLSPADYADYLRARQAAVSTVVAPPGGTPGKQTGGKKLRELHPETREVLSDIFADPSVHRTGQYLEVEPTDGGKKFTMNVKRFVQSMRARSQMGAVQNWSTEHVDKVLGVGG